jgi:fluoride exporter
MSRPHEPGNPAEPHRSGPVSGPVDPDVEIPPGTAVPVPHPWSLIRVNADLLPVIAAGGALGSLARWGLGRALPHAAGSFAWSTFLTNASGALLLGVLMALMLEVWSHTRYVRPFVGVGILGGYTTFSTYVLDARNQAAAGHLPVAAAYVVATLLLGILAVVAGLETTRWALRRRGATRSDPR